MDKNEFEDDGRTIADMSSTRRTSWYSNLSTMSRKKRAGSEPFPQPVQQPVEMTKAETRQYIFSAVLAGLAIALLFIGLAFLFILFCIYVWF